MDPVAGLLFAWRLNARGPGCRCPIWAIMWQLRHIGSETGVPLAREKAAAPGLGDGFFPAI
jgi:hypothetical protein